MWLLDEVVEEGDLRIGVKRARGLLTLAGAWSLLTPKEVIAASSQRV